MTSNQKRRRAIRSAARPHHHPHRGGARWSLLVLACAVLLGACSSGGPILQSQNVSSNARYPLRGTSYYLPKKLLRIRVWEYEVYALDKDGKKINKTADPAMDTEYKTLWVPFAVHAKDGSDELIVPDHRHQFLIAPMWDVASDDNIHVKLDADGLLSQVHSSAADQRTEIARNAIDLFSMLVSGNPQPAGKEGPRTRAGANATGTAPRFIAEYEFDPIDPTDMARVRSDLSTKYGISVSLTKQPDCPSASSGGDCHHTCDCTKPGIYYRLPIPYRLRLEPAGRYRPPGVLGSQNGEWEVLSGGMEQTVLMPNEAICIYAPVTRAAFVTSYTNLDFERGMLTEAVTDKPSQMLGFIRIPIDAASAILAIPAELLTLRIKQTSQRTGLAEAQYMNLQQQVNALEAARLLEAKKAGGSGGGGDTYAGE